RRSSDFVASSADSAYDGLPVDTVAVAITDNDGVPLAAINLSLSSNTANETDSPTITVTATASIAVSTDQSVTLDISGDGITLGDYLLSDATITIAAGETTGSVSLTITDDAHAEAAESALLSLVDFSAEISPGTTTTQTLDIVNNDQSVLTRVGSYHSANGAEIAALDPATGRVFVVAGPIIEILAMDATGALALDRSE